MLAGVAALIGTGAVSRPGGRRSYAKRVRRIVYDELLELHVAVQGQRGEQFRLRMASALDLGALPGNWPEALEQDERLLAEIASAEPRRSAELREGREHGLAAFEEAHATGLGGAERIHRRLVALRAPRGSESVKARHVDAAAEYASAYRALDAAWRAQHRELLVLAGERVEAAQAALVSSVETGLGNAPVVT